MKANTSVHCYVLAALAVAVTTGCGLLLFQFGESRPFPLFFLPILFSAWFFGRGAGLLATVLSAAAIQYFFIPPVWSFGILYPVDWGSQIIFIGEGIVVAVFAAGKKKDEEDLERRVVERTVQVELTNQDLRTEIEERKLAQLKLQTQERLAAIGRTAAVLAHEIATPLTGMSLAIQIVKQQLANHAELSEDMVFGLRALSNEISRLTSLAQNFRSIGRPEHIELKPTNLSVIAKEIFALEKSSYADRGIEVALHFPPDLPWLMVDSDKIKQVLLNLCRNAVDAMPEGGQLTIKAFVSGEQLHLYVIDTGIGISEGIDVFEPFATTKPEGTGLGLMIVKQIVLAHQGTIDYTSEPGRGTTFKLQFPLLQSS